jgi:hypothetical protein
MITAQEFLKELDEESGTIWTEDDDEICKAFIEFAKLHVKAALNTIYEKGLSDITTWDGNSEGSEYLDFDKLIEAYPLDKIK